MPTKKSRRKDRFDATLDLFESRCPKSTPTQPLPATAPPIQDPLAGFDLKIQEVLEQELKSAATKELPPACDPHQPPADPYPEQKDWIPARMLNEFVYCQRLFFYEHVEGLFVDNSDTTRGRTLHKRVDSGSGALPTPEAVPEGQQIHSRSVSLGSERLGVTAKLDLVESSADRTVIPVDYKIGAPREDADGLKLWPTDRMQLGLQILLLRDNGYSCSEGFIYYRATKQRVSLLHSADLESWVLGQIDAARSTARGQIPPPLVASEKCTRCSLNSICLPDETWMKSASMTSLMSHSSEISKSPPKPSIPSARPKFPSPIFPWAVGFTESLVGTGLKTSSPASSNSASLATRPHAFASLANVFSEKSATSARSSCACTPPRQITPFLN